MCLQYRLCVTVCYNIGVMLGHYQIMKYKRLAGERPLAVLASVVSSRMLQAIATAEGVRYSDTLTGNIS